MSFNDEINYYMDIQAYNLNTDVVDTLRFGTNDLTTKPSDTPSNTIYESRVEQPGNIQYNLFGQSRLGGAPSIGSGTVKLNNIDGGLDYLNYYAFGGRTIDVYRLEGNDFSQKTIWFSGTVESALIDYSTVTLRVRDKAYPLTFEINQNKYAGDNVPPNGIEGTENDIKGTTKPLLYGRCNNVTPILVNFSKLIYQIHDGSVEDILDVYDGRTTYSFVSDVVDNTALQALSVSAGEYYTCLAEGLIRVGTKPEKGITVDAKGDNSGGYIDRAGEIIKRIVENQTELTNADIDNASFTQFDIDYNYETGIYTNGSDKVIDVISSVIGPLNAFYFDRSGIMFLSVFSLPSAPSFLSITDDEVVGEIKRTANGDDSKGVPVYSLNYEWGRNFTIQKENDVYGSVTADDIAFTSQQYRTINVTDSAIKTKYPLSPDITVTSQIFNEADAQTDSVRVSDIYKEKYSFYTLKVESTYVSDLSLNDVVELIINRFGFDNGGYLRVTGIKLNSENGISNIELFG